VGVASGEELVGVGIIDGLRVRVACGVGSGELIVAVGCGAWEAVGVAVAVTPSVGSALVRCKYTDASVVLRISKTMISDAQNDVEGRWPG